MPYRLLSGKNQDRLVMARLGVPLITFILGVSITLYLGSSFQRAEMKARVAALNSSAQDYLKQLDMTMLNSTLRVQSTMDIYGPTATKIIRQRQFVEEIVRHTMFQRISVYRLTGFSDDSLPILKRIYFSRIAGDELPMPHSPLMRSVYIRQKIRTMTDTGRQSAFAINHSDRGDTIHLIWHSPTNPADYVVFSAPLKSVFLSLPIGIPLSATLSDPDTNLRLLVKWDEYGKIEVLNNPRAGEKPEGQMSGFFGKNGDSDFSSLQLAWIAQPDRSLGYLTWTVGIAGLLITLLMSLMLRFVIDQNRKIAGLVVSRTVDLESALDDATEANLAKTRFLANMSHELRTPLNIILGLLDLLEEKVADAKGAEFLKTIRLSGDHLLSLITDLLNVAQRDHSQDEMTVKRVPIKCPMFFEEIVRLASPDCRNKGLMMKFEIDHDIPAYFRGDPARVRQVLINLLRNAIKYTTTGHVSLKISRVAADPTKKDQLVTLRIVVSDTGVGIPRLRHQQIFDRFMQLESSKVLSQGGVGLGLSIVKDLVERLGGNIAVESEVGLGSRFAVDLDFEVIDNRTWTESFVGAQKNTLKLAVISDRPEFVEMLKSYLQGGDIEILALKTETWLGQLNFTPSDIFTHIVLDQRARVDWDQVPSSMLNKILLVGNEVELLQDLKSKRLKVIDENPLLPTQLWNALGIRQIEAITRRAVEQAVVSLPITTDRQLSLLIADDDAGNRHLFEAYFAQFNWRISFSENGKQALERYQQARPDVVIADLRMPIMDGFEMTDHVRAFEVAKNLKTVPIILVTADALDETAEKARKHGVTAFLTKPIRKAKIVATVLSVTNK